MPRMRELGQSGKTLQANDVSLRPFSVEGVKNQNHKLCVMSVVYTTLVNAFMMHFRTKFYLYSPYGPLVNVMKLKAKYRFCEPPLCYFTLYTGFSGIMSGVV